jgi:hypothetical protein
VRASNKFKDYVSAKNFASEEKNPKEFMDTMNRLVE